VLRAEYAILRSVSSADNSEFFQQINTNFEFLTERMSLTVIIFVVELCNLLTNQENEMTFESFGTKCCGNAGCCVHGSSHEYYMSFVR